MMTMFVVGFPVAGDHTISYVKVCSVAGVVKDVREPGTNTALVRVACRRVSEAAASNTHTHTGAVLRGEIVDSATASENTAHAQPYTTREDSLVD